MTTKHMGIIAFDDRDGYIWMDGQIVAWRDAKIHVLTHGLHYGSSVFEGERAYAGKVFKGREHSERFHRSAELLGYKIPYDVDQLIAAKDEILRVNGVTDGYLRPVAWRGSEMMAISAQQTIIHVAIACWAWPSMYKADIKENGIRLTMAKFHRPSPETAPTASKAAGLYMICTISKHQAEAAGFQDALMLDYRGYLAEATGANLFLVINGRHIKPEELARTQEVFLTGTAAEITPVGEIDGQKFTVGPVTKKLMDLYSTATRAHAIPTEERRRVPRA